MTITLTKEILIKARDTLPSPSELLKGSYYDEETGRYCALGWIAHVAGISLCSGLGQLDEYRNFEGSIPFAYKLVELNDDCPDKVKQALDEWIEEWK